MDNAPVAQWIEQQPSKLSATGSSPVGGTNKTTAMRDIVTLCQRDLDENGIEND